ncbi:MAG: hypothetical protein ACI95T_001096 [Flavobacteriales bacterium]|jgi:hypothetical protein|tara:strand:- start:1597 stop:2085 length:489 start_codon:yes stop_codon:yes gene_type:complete
MKINYLKICSMGILSLSFIAVNGQSSTNSSGGDATGTGGSASSSVGQSVYTTNSSTSGSAAQGVQHAFKISVSTGLKKANGITLEMSVFPNPTIGVLNLSIGKYDKQNLSYQIYTNNGKLVESKKIRSIKTTIAMSHLSSATYIILISENNQTIKNFKIIKK